MDLVSHKISQKFIKSEKSQFRKSLEIRKNNFLCKMCGYNNTQYTDKFHKKNTILHQYKSE